MCKWICNSRLLGFSPILLINIVASTLWQMKVSSMKLYFGTLVEHFAEIWRMLNAAEGYGSSALPDWLTIQICAL